MVDMITLNSSTMWSTPATSSNESFWNFPSLSVSFPPIIFALDLPNSSIMSAFGAFFVSCPRKTCLFSHFTTGSCFFRPTFRPALRPASALNHVAKNVIAIMGQIVGSIATNGSFVSFRHMNCDIAVLLCSGRCRS